MTINAFLVAVKVVRDIPEDMATLEKIKRLDALDQAALNAADEIAELRNLCRKITTRGQTVSAEDMERIREIVGG